MFDVAYFPPDEGGFDMNRLTAVKLPMTIAIYVTDATGIFRFTADWRQRFQSTLKGLRIDRRGKGDAKDCGKHNHQFSRHRIYLPYAVQ
jgi:hypothetical protein